MSTPTQEGVARYDIAQARRVAERWESTGYGVARLTVRGDEWRLELATGGWSANEDMLVELQLGYRGGRHVLGSYGWQDDTASKIAHVRLAGEAPR